jgi:hypothetical protein
MNNKMNIDMGDFFGGGAEPSPPVKKETRKSLKSGSRFGFGSLMSSPKLKAGGNRSSVDGTFKNN